MPSIILLIISVYYEKIYALYIKRLEKLSSCHKYVGIELPDKFFVLLTITLNLSDIIRLLLY